MKPSRKKTGPSGPAVFVGITGASGSVIGLRLMECLIEAGRAVHAVMSESGALTLACELQLKGKLPSLKGLMSRRRPDLNWGGLREYSNRDFFAPAASGTSEVEAVAVVPCSMKTLSSIANGYSETLIARAADVALKEHKRCVLVPRETPLNLIHAENLLKVMRAGARVVLPVPGYYAYPRTIDDVTDYVVGRVLDQLDVPHSLLRRWGKETPGSREVSGRT
jgi:4-hydroxy-3-polyprenylbenzoate decarboxylase